MKKTLALATALSLTGCLLSPFGINKAMAIISANSSAEVVIGQQDMTNGDDNQGSSVNVNTLKNPRNIHSDGTKLFIADCGNNRVLIYNQIPTSNNASADVVVGQSNMVSNSANQGGSVGTNTLSCPTNVYSNGTKMFISDYSNNRVLIYNQIPTSNNASADVVVGQSNMVSNSANQGGSVGANTLKLPQGVYSDGTKLIIADYNNNRVLIYNQIPTSNNASADVVVGQPNMTSNSNAQGANGMWGPNSVFISNSKLFVSEFYNNRILIFNHVPTSNNASSDVVVGQADMNSHFFNRDDPSYMYANTLSYPSYVYADGTKLYIADGSNNRVLIFNTVPSSNYQDADTVIGQTALSGELNFPLCQSNSLSDPGSVFSYGSKLFISDSSNNRVLIYKLKPTLAEVTGISSSTQSTTPSYTFSSDEEGTISYGGDCSSSTTQAVVGNNTVTFNALGEGSHNNCTITVTNGAGFASSALSVNNFSVDTTTASVSSVNYSRKKASRKITLTFYGLSLGKTKRKVTLKLNGRSATTTSVRGSGANTNVGMLLKYTKWPKGSYNLVMNYRYKSGKRWVKGSRTKNGLITIM